MDEALYDNDDTLIRYLDGEMEPQEKKIIQQRLQSDAALKERLLNLQLAIAAVQQYGTSGKVKAIHTEMMQELSPVQKPGKVLSMKAALKYGIAVAASVIVIVVGINLYKSGQINSDKLYSEAFVDYDASVVRGQQNTSALQTSYQDHRYDAVTGQANAKNLSQKDSLLIGLSYLKLNQTAPAINWLKALTKNGTLSDDAEFYLSLAYLKNKNYGEAAGLMKSIEANPQHGYHNQFTQAYIEKVEKLASK